MVQKINLYYAYFRFFIDENEIADGLTKYCKDWTMISGIGYNYKEYKCYTHNHGGLELWAGNMQGYITQNRESAFLDGAPSENVFDQTMLMGACRLLLNKDTFDLLDGFAKGAVFLFRKITSTDSGAAHEINISFGGLQTIEHPVMYTFDSTKIEKVKQVAEGHENSSTVDNFKVSVDINAEINNLDVYQNDNVIVTDHNKAFDCDINTYTLLESNIGGYSNIVYDCGGVKNNVSTYFHNYNGGYFYCNVYLYYSLDAVSWTLLDNTPSYADGYHCFSGRELEFRYLRFFLQTQTSSPAYKSRVKLCELITS